VKRVGGIVPFEGRAKGQHGSTPVHAKERVPQHEIRPADGVWISGRPEQLGGARPQNPNAGQGATPAAFGQAALSKLKPAYLRLQPMRLSADGNIKLRYWANAASSDPE
jgi:hypothetical protein